MAQIFISYSRIDRPYLLKIISLIRTVYGHDSLWFDGDIHGGADWWDMILKEIEKCDLFIYLISDDSSESPYCQSELREALRLHKHILPVIVRRLKLPYPGNIPDDLKIILGKIQYVDLINIRHNTSIANLYAAIHHLVKQLLHPLVQATAQIAQPPVHDRKLSPWERMTEGQGIVIAAVIGMIGVISAALISLSGVLNPKKPTEELLSTAMFLAPDNVYITQTAELLYMPCSSGLPVRLQIDSTGQIVTSGDGLNVYENYSVKSTPINRLNNANTVTILEGPICSEGSNWWRIRTTEEITGWIPEGAGQEYFVYPLD